MAYQGQHTNRVRNLLMRCTIDFMHGVVSSGGSWNHCHGFLSLLKVNYFSCIKGWVTLGLIRRNHLELFGVIMAYTVKLSLYAHCFQSKGIFGLLAGRMPRVGCWTLARFVCEAEEGMYQNTWALLRGCQCMC